jgi:hypothetical protein
LSALFFALIPEFALTPIINLGFFLPGFPGFYPLLAFTVIYAAVTLQQD